MLLTGSSVFLLGCLLSVSALSMTVYKNALFRPFASGYQLAAQLLVNATAIVSVSRACFLATIEPVFFYPPIYGKDA